MLQLQRAAAADRCATGQYAVRRGSGDKSANHDTSALNTVEPPIVERSMAFVLERDQPWYEARLPMLDDRVRGRLAQLSAHLGDAEWLDGAFSAADLMMVTVLRRAGSSGLLEEHPNLGAYIARGEARPAYQRAFEAQLAVFRG